MILKSLPSKSVPKRAPRNHSSLPAKSANARRVEAHHRTLNKKNRVDSNLLVKHSVFVSNSNNDCGACNKSLVFSNHNACLVMCDDSVNDKPHPTKRSTRQPTKEWKPINKVGKPIKRVWNSISKNIANTKPQWKPTGRHFSLYELHPLTRIMEPSAETLALSPSVSSSAQITMISRFPDCKFCDPQSGSKGISEKFIGIVRFGNDEYAAIVGYGDYKVGDTIISRVYYVEGLKHNLFLVGQFCDGGLEVAFRQHSCHIRNYDMMDLLRMKTLIVIEKFIVKTQRALNATVRFVRTDNGTEFVNKTLNGWFESVAPLFLWAEAVATACYTLNRSLVHTLHGKTYYELLKGKKPNLQSSTRTASIRKSDTSVLEDLKALSWKTCQEGSLLNLSDHSKYEHVGPKFSEWRIEEKITKQCVWQASHAKTRGVECGELDQAVLSDPRLCVMGGFKKLCENVSTAIKWDILPENAEHQKVKTTEIGISTHKGVTGLRCSEKAMCAIDGARFDWSDMAEEEIQANMALMAFTDSEGSRRLSNNPRLNEYGPRDSSVKPTTGCDKESDNSKENTDDSLKQQQKTDSKTSSLKVDKDWKENFFYPANQVREEAPKKARENNDAPIIEDWVSDDEDDVEPIPKVEKKTVIPTATKKEFVKPEKPVRRSVRHVLSVEVLITFNTCPNVHKHMVPRAVLMKTGLKTVNNARPVNTVRAITRNDKGFVK
ncbi:integrase, catalytic region, zinc finger, CCHC-type containing protein [Tanacetum coccineum]